MGSQINPKSMENRGFVADAFLERFWAALGRQQTTACFPSKIEKWHPKKHPKIRPRAEGTR